ncbi:MAG: hypothetical protein HQ582_24740 [Planctomycetes bacterium]|nr:hypothetical protein [Planctomycetota bacterium]
MSWAERVRSGWHSSQEPDSILTWRMLGHVALASAILLIGGWFSWKDAVVLTGAAVAVRGATRRLLAVGVVVLFSGSFPPLSWPTYWFCFAPLVWMWREREPKQPVARHALEAVAIGFAMGWLSTGFVRAAVPAWGWLLHGGACIVFSLQFIGIALAIRLLRNIPIVLAGALTAVVAVGCEALEAWCGIAWSVTSFCLPVGGTPIAQWAAWVTPLGVAGMVYWVSFLMVPDWRATKFWLRWLGPASGVAIGMTAWFGGGLIAAATTVDPMPFSVMLVQPHLKGEEQDARRPWIALDRLTQASLDDEGPVDLVVWPESCLSGSPVENPATDVGDPSRGFEHRLTVADFTATLRPRYKTSCLAGVAMWRRTIETRFGLQVPKIERYNCGCLVSGSGEIACYEKQVLVPFKEGLPPWLDQAWIRSRVLPFFQLEADLSASDRFRLLSFRDHDDEERTIAVSICYESFLFWLPQYRKTDSIDAVVHLVYDGVWADHPEVIQRQILACRFRAIETRRWNLVCSTWAGSAIIDPRGEVVARLPARAGVLRSDRGGRFEGAAAADCVTTVRGRPGSGLMGG